MQGEKEREKKAKPLVRTSAGDCGYGRKHKRSFVSVSLLKIFISFLLYLKIKKKFKTRKSDLGKKLFSIFYFVEKKKNKIKK